MDTITHTLTGLVLSRAGLNKLTPYATPLLLLAANAPDIDNATGFFGVSAYLRYHRHLTHALIAVPVLALLCVLVVRLIVRKPLPWLGAFLAALVGLLSHAFLDWCNAYGTRLLLPFSGESLRADLLSLPDVWIWLILGVAWLAPSLSRLVSSEIGGRSSGGRGWAIAALVLVSLYLFGRWTLHERALAVLEAHMHQGVSAKQVAALPHRANPFLWRGVVDGGEFYAIYEVNLLTEFDPSAAQILYRAIPGDREVAAMKAVRQVEPFRAFLEFSYYPLWRFYPAPEGENALRVELLDMRFGSTQSAGFVASATVDARNHVENAAFRFRPQAEAREAGR